MAYYYPGPQDWIPTSMRPPGTPHYYSQRAVHRACGLKIILGPDLLYNAAFLFLPYFYRSRIHKVLQDVKLTENEIIVHNGVNPQEYVPPSSWGEVKLSWEEFLDSVLAEWTTLNIVSALLLSAIYNILQLGGHGSRVVQCTALLSLICALISLIFGCLYLIRFETMRRPYKAMQWASDAFDTSRSTWWNVYILLALPSIWLAWSLILFIVCLMAIVWQPVGPTANNGGIGPLPLAVKATVSVLLAVGAIHLFIVLVTFARYGETFDETWREKLNSITMTPPPNIPAEIPQPPSIVMPPHLPQSPSFVRPRPRSPNQTIIARPPSTDDSMESSPDSPWDDWNRHSRSTRRPRARSSRGYEYHDASSKRQARSAFPTLLSGEDGQARALGTDDVQNRRHIRREEPSHSGGEYRSPPSQSDSDDAGDSWYTPPQEGSQVPPATRRLDDNTILNSVQQQQRESERHLRELYEWLSRDVRDRRDEMRGVNARLDEMMNRMNRMVTPQSGPQFTAYSAPGRPQMPEFTAYPAPGRPQMPEFTAYPAPGRPQMPEFTAYPAPGRPQIPEFTAYPAPGRPQIPEFMAYPAPGRPQMSYPAPGEPQMLELASYPTPGRPQIPAFTSYPAPGRPQMPYPAPGEPQMLELASYPTPGEPQMPELTAYSAPGGPQIPEVTYSRQPRTVRFARRPRRPRTLSTVRNATVQIPPHDLSIPQPPPQLAPGRPIQLPPPHELSRSALSIPQFVPHLAPDRLIRLPPPHELSRSALSIPQPPPQLAPDRPIRLPPPHELSRSALSTPHPPSQSAPDRP